MVLIRTKTELDRQQSTKHCFWSEIRRKNAYRERVLKQQPICVCLGYSCSIWYHINLGKESWYSSVFLNRSTISKEAAYLCLLTQLHLIHWNSTLFGSIDEAVGKLHGIAIIALFVQVNGLLWLLIVQMPISKSFCRIYIFLKATYFIFLLKYSWHTTY